MDRWVLHVDLDQFIAAVEVLRRPELRGQPVVVGGEGDPTRRGVVSTASYEARAHGIRSGMPLRTAHRRCPEAAFLAVDQDAYLAASHRVMAVLRSFPAVVQVTGWDEAFMAAATDDPEALAREVQRAVYERTGLWCSVGVGDNRLRAKLASGFAKPAGVFRLTRAEWPRVMDGRPTAALWGVGARTATRLAALGIRTVGELALAPDEQLAHAFGPAVGPWLRRLATGEDASAVTDVPRVPRGRGKERTFQENVGDPAEVRRLAAALAQELAGDLAGDLAGGARRARRIVLKVRFAPFVTVTRAVAMPEPSSEGRAIEAAVMAALSRIDLDRPVRLLGVRAELEDPPAPRAGTPGGSTAAPHGGAGAGSQRRGRGPARRMT
ncbi:MAG: DNA polymerase IV [Candidatus Dormibacteraeota bacterium]|nr:DNA polymerase IV [Candidatus Dormibacteraeota bacterium]MBO0761257.1 DNA polymerase IV [Candidatus Dormibacteraeota bacterium]